MGDAPEEIKRRDIGLVDGPRSPWPWSAAGTLLLLAGVFLLVADLLKVAMVRLARMGMARSGHP